MVIYVIIGLLLWSFSVCAQVIKFAPLPTRPKEKLIAEHVPLIKYLEKKTGYRFEIVYFSDYREILENFKAGSVNLISIGPVPYLELKKSFPHAQPIAVFKNEEGKTSYTCVCFTTFDGPKSLKDVKGPIALPQKLSTCGYFSASILLSSVKKDINSMKFENFDTHNQVVQNLLAGGYEMGCVRKNVFRKYSGYALRVLGESPEWPEFTIVANSQTLSRDAIQRIREALLSIKPEEMAELIEGKYGFALPREEDYRRVDRYERHRPAF